ncbi:MAG: nucleotidyltransferase domain-containing protein [Flavobacteriales bacterium]|jgi:hypothetical protein|nr:nucleotidyltransferase domain-containing protein [Flavobacteriales bacterium]
MHIHPTENISSILKALAYFDVFSYPLSYEELYQYSKFEDKVEFDRELQELIEKQFIHNLDGFYSLIEDIKIVKERIEGEKRAEKYLFQAVKKSKLIAKFPYVRGVFISGSLSKGVMAEDGDIDFFIITKPNRLWIARTLLILYKKTILLNSRKYFCVNYFIDEEQLEIEQKNRFTATEIVTLIPMVNNKLYQQFIEANQWINEYYIHAKSTSKYTIELKRSLFQNFVEPILNMPLGERVDAYFMKLTLKRWKQKFGTMENADFDVALKTTKRVSKHHPSNFQAKVIQKYNQIIEDITNT